MLKRALGTGLLRDESLLSILWYFAETDCAHSFAIQTSSERRHFVS